MNMTDILAAFASEPLFAASAKFLKHLGVKFSTQTEEPIPFLELYEEAATEANATLPKDIKAIFSRVENTYFIGTVTDDTLKGENAGVDFKTEAAKPKYEGMFVFAVEMKPGETLKRSEAAVIVRGINRVVKQQPATVLILEDTLLSVATCERTAFKQAWRPGERLGKVSILKGVNCLSPHHGHIDILESMNVKGCKSFDELYAQWQKVFNTSILTNKFYSELLEWYIWAADPKTDVYFPNDPDDDNDDYEGRETKIIRLITRVMFVWFIRQKKLVPDWIFDENYLVRILKDFDPAAADSGNYYNAVLQNLFFATLNRAIEDEDGKRRFAELQGHVDAKNLYRYDELYTISKDEIVEHFASIPFVNGSLFECLDKTKGNDGVGKAFYYDGFSRNDKKVPSTNHYRYRAFVPNNLFFDPDRGLYSLFDRYNFTIEENTPLEQQVALDPELLGKVFENLLGVYNGETTRDESGSFYTPREIVDYMVDETLIAYLGDTKLVRNLFSESFTYNELDWSEYQTLAAKLKTVKILDPACGSGAFPVGMLNRIVEILGKLKTDRGDVFKLKRHIIENCIYGSDIQCIAAQITKLRFFISLIVNCERDESKKNFGIPELPNLETKFVAANSLVGLEKIEKGQDLFENPKVVDIAEELRRVRHDHFNANTAARKRRLVKKDAELRKKLFDELNGNFFQQKGADLVAQWNPYDQNTSSEFFDPEWMFGIKDGFDIVIGNPPYVEARSSKFPESLKVQLQKQLKQFYSEEDAASFPRGADLLIFFYELAFRTMKKNGGINTFITENSWLSTNYGKLFQNFLLKHIDILGIVDSDYRYFDGADVNTVITFFGNKAESEVRDVKFFHCHGNLAVYPCNIGNVQSDGITDVKVLPSDSMLLQSYKWGFLNSLGDELLPVFQRLLELNVSAIQEKFAIGQGLNVTKDCIRRPEDGVNPPYYIAECGAQYAWTNTGSYVDAAVVKSDRRIPKLILPRGIGTHFCCRNMLDGYTASYVEIYSDTATEDEILAVWLFCNSSLLWLLRECSGRCNLGGGMLKAEATDMKALPLYFDFKEKDLVRDIFNRAMHHEFSTKLGATLDDPLHKEIDKVVFSHLGIAGAEELVLRKLVDKINVRCHKSKTAKKQK